ncbi:MAG: response regulator transcription factor [Flavobacteriales bacterium]|nr:response regulator transcription factor [Flavobacteriales bacterium]MBK6892286.1 response regulator transcription factor [Flavobacteriales bacterium]MBK7246419.1 response regulator transcription factor [Flavobacteriales bacterium]MBK9060592.1 response regulator transcription factor [Flavobacteriales bacterium]MBK9597457.1 response regulator transcription factor [Flavobacteriales bacterium]
MTLLLADDQSIILDGLEALLQHDPDVHVVGRASNGLEAVERAKELQPDVVLMDISMPKMDGIEATRELMKCCTSTRVLMLTMYGNKEFVNEMLEAGASGFLLKNVGKEELRTALRTVAAGQQYIAKEVQRMLEGSDNFKDRRGEQVYVSLTKREKEVVMLVCKEYTTQEIATALFLSPQTIDTHRKNILHKLDLRNVAGLVKYAMERGWCCA